jgi:hypothetical protein
MDRGPIALFGAIVAVGLGPALWLGAQFGHFEVAPPSPPVPVDRTHDETTTQLMGGTGGGEDETAADNTRAGATPHAHAHPVHTTHSARPSASPTDTTPSVPPTTSHSPSPSTSPSASPDPSSGGGGDDHSVPPSPPSDGDSTSPPAGGGDGTAPGDNATGAADAHTADHIDD